MVEKNPSDPLGPLAIGRDVHMTNTSTTPTAEKDSLSEAIDRLFYDFVLGANDVDEARRNLFRLGRWAAKTQQHVGWLIAQATPAEEGAA